jgi:hypothetical protein
MAVAIVGIGIAAAGLISSFIGAKKSASAAKSASKKEARAEHAVTSERIRQLNVEERVLAGDTIAATAASGVKVGQGSPLEILAEQAREFHQEKLVTRQVGATKAAAALQSGRDVGNAVKYQSYSNLASGASNIFSIMNNAGMFSSGTSTTNTPQPGVGGI